ncbi:MAG TPA: hypothetical protein VEY91_06820 [Candidatus Limnocylindria bacterium]|nr:hypothetical protein [Candidatus Limnocylindria bacterium]
MKHALAAALAALGLFATPARAQVFGQFVPADPLPVNGHMFGGYLHASESVVGLLAQLRMSFYPNMDFGFHGGLTRVDLAGSDKTTLRVGTDLKVQVARVDQGLPVDIAIGGALSLENGDDFNVLSLGPSIIASRPLNAGGTALVPYGSVGLFYSSLDIGTRDATDVAFPIRLGAEFRVASEFRIIGELQLLLEDEFNDDIGFVTGVNLPF